MSTFPLIIRMTFSENILACRDYYIILALLSVKSAPTSSSLKLALQSVMSRQVSQLRGCGVFVCLFASYSLHFYVAVAVIIDKVYMGLGGNALSSV